MNISCKKTEELRQYLLGEFENRCRKNKNYSLRAFAKSLSIDSSYLSKILNSKRKLNQKALYSLAEKLNFPQSLTFIEKTKGDISKRAEFNDLSVEQFRVVSDWYHYAILEIINLDDFVPDANWISKALNISLGEAISAIERLKKQGLLVIDENNKWKSVPNTTTKNKFSDAAFKNLQKQILNGAIEALETVGFADRDQSSITMCVDQSRLTQAKLKIKKFRRELMEFLEGGESKDEVYQMSFSLYPVTQIKKKKEATK